MEIGSRRGQLFLIGAILFAILITGIVLLNQGALFVFTGPDTPKEVFDRAVEEYPVALNTVIRSSSAPGDVKRRIATYLGFQIYAARGHAIEARQHTVVLLPNSTGLTGIVGNFRGTTLENVSLT
ncbi:MAG: hypothetical protein ABEI07_02500, partial [Candidatus Nanohaloarchaea archaeon]